MGFTLHLLSPEIQRAYNPTALIRLWETFTLTFKYVAEVYLRADFSMVRFLWSCNALLLCDGGIIILR